MCRLTRLDIKNKIHQLSKYIKSNRVPVKFGHLLDYTKIALITWATFSGFRGTKKKEKTENRMINYEDHHS